MPAPPEPAPLGSDTCRAEQLQDLIGQNITVLQTMRFGVTVRVIGPDTPVTKDFRPDRVNIIHDKTGLITKIACY